MTILQQRSQEFAQPLGKIGIDLVYCNLCPFYFIYLYFIYSQLDALRDLVPFVQF